MDYLVLNITTYGLGIIFWISFYSNYSLVRRILYGVSSHIAVSVLICFLINVILPTYISSQLVFASAALLGICLYFIDQKKDAVKKSFFQENANLVFVSFFCVFIFSFLVNTAIQSERGLNFPIVGMNDDTATHLAMSVMAIKKESLLFKNSILEALISRGINYQNARFYPPTVYTYTALLYNSFSYKTNPLDLHGLLNIYAVFSFLIFMIFIFSIIDLAFNLVKSINIWSYTPIIVFVLFFVAGEYFMVLYRMSYLTQLLGNAFLLMFFVFLSEVGLKREASPDGMNYLQQLKVGIFILGVGLTYYLFLPVVAAGLAFWFLKSLDLQHVKMGFVKNVLFFVNKIKNCAVLITLFFISFIPLCLYSISYSVFEQITIPGINLITLATLIQFCLMVLLFVVLKNYFVSSTYRLSIVGFLTSLILAVATTTPSMLKNGALPYYFYKSFFTSATFAVAFGMADILTIVSQINRHLHRLSYTKSFLLNSLLWVVLPLVFVLYLYAYKTLIPGYKGITYLANGFFNYYKPYTTQKLIGLYNDLYDKKPTIYNPGYWGENILLFALFENIPQIHIDGTRREIFYFSQNPNYYLEDIVKEHKAGKQIYVFDGHGSFKPKISK